RSFASAPEIRRALSGEVASGRRHSEQLDTTVVYVAVPVASAGVVGGAVRITYPATAADSRVRRSWLILATISVLALVVAGALAVWLARWASRPLVGLEATASAVSEGNLDARAPLDGPPE